MKNERFHFAAMTLFVLGFVLAGSGWAPLIALGFQGRPSYSVCGQDMCLCLPSTMIEPDCPLCLGAGDDDSDCSSESGRTPKRLPNTERFDSISSASQAGCMSVYLSLLLAHRDSTALLIDLDPIARIEHDRVPMDPLRDIPAPPPRA